MTERFKKGLKYYKEGKYQQASDTFLEIVTENNQNHNAWNALGVTISKLGNLSEAYNCFENALTLDPENPIYKKNLEQIKQKEIEKISENNSQIKLRENVGKIASDSICIKPTNLFLGLFFLGIIILDLSFRYLQLDFFFILYILLTAYLVYEDVNKIGIANPNAKRSIIKWDSGIWGLMVFLIWPIFLPYYAYKRNKWCSDKKNIYSEKEWSFFLKFKRIIFDSINSVVWLTKNSSLIEAILYIVPIVIFFTFIRGIFVGNFFVMIGFFGGVIFNIFSTVLLGFVICLLLKRDIELQKLLILSCYSITPFIAISWINNSFLMDYLFTLGLIGILWYASIFFFSLKEIYNFSNIELIIAVVVGIGIIAIITLALNMIVFNSFLTPANQEIWSRIQTQVN